MERVLQLNRLSKRKGKGCQNVKHLFLFYNTKRREAIDYYFVKLNVGN